MRDPDRKKLLNELADMIETMESRYPEHVIAEAAENIMKRHLRRVILAEVIEELKQDRRQRTYQCRNCGSENAHKICGDADRVIFACRMGTKAESWVEYFERRLEEA